MNRAHSLLAAVAMLALCACNSSNDKEARAKQAQQISTLQKQVTSLQTDVTSLRTELAKFRDLLRRSPYVLAKGVEIKLPHGNTNPTPAIELVVTISRDGKVFVADKALPDADLEKTFAAAFARDKDTQVVIRADNHVSHGRVVAVMEQAKRVGLQRIAIATQSK